MGAHPTEGYRHYDGDSAWWSMLFVGGYDFTNPPPMITPEGIKPFPNKGARQLHARTSFLYTATGITPAMCMRLTNVGSQYLIANVDPDGVPFDGSQDLHAAAARRTYLPPGSGHSPCMTTRPARCCRHHSATHGPAARATPLLRLRRRRTDRRWCTSRRHSLRASRPATGSRPTQTRGWFVALRLYSPLASFFDKTWRPGEIELAN